ncbi:MULTISPECIES: phage portal protein [unclassified Dehalobacter]|uniref:phage portal protein n=1 Tax=unclassified Dehalobacter TaxID=2635733 RepID=UPI001046DABD|nr:MULTISPECIES: phage portal protein [unclassified Dehalobacter]TCX51939.1 phage portal protein [Dehalobacter sp. 14DCB1]TCX52999.1 phage portal protein [Dehalobacter sp. 12DCB1]
MSKAISAKVIKSSEPRATPIKKSDKPEAINEKKDGVLWLEPDYEQKGFKDMVEHSTILPQCIRAYKDNIVGFGIEIKYQDDVEETPEMAAEYTRAEEIIELLNLDMDTKEVFEDIIESRETYGVSYLEVLRNIANEVNQVEFIRDTPSIKKTHPLEPSVEIEYFYKGKVIKRMKKFCKYKQEKNGKTVYFREIGDPRQMDKRTGKYAEDGETIELSNQANEILEFSIGTNDYGTVRWIGQVLSVDGARKAENLNNNYFTEGRHTPLMIVVKGGSLSDESFTKLTEYMNGIKGESGQHAFIVLEVEEDENKVDFETEKTPAVEIKDLASILQKDELFQDYLENSRKKTQSAFRLPDLYTGYTTDFNRATAQTAMEVTEKQVFIPERISLAWTINNKLLNGYQFKYVEVGFRNPDITNPDDVTKILNVTERAGGLTPNIAKEITLETLGRVAEPYEGDWGDIPLAVSRGQVNAMNTANAGGTTGGPQNLTQQIDQAIQKAISSKDDNVIAVMKEIRKALVALDGKVS